MNIWINYWIGLASSFVVGACLGYLYREYELWRIYGRSLGLEKSVSRASGSYSVDEGYADWSKTIDDCNCCICSSGGWDSFVETLDAEEETPSKRSNRHSKRRNSSKRRPKHKMGNNNLLGE